MCTVFGSGGEGTGADLGVGVGPEQLGAGLVDGEAVGPAQVVADQHRAVRAVHGGALQLGVLSPIRPVHVSGKWTEQI